MNSNKTIFFLLLVSLAVGCGDDDSVTDTGPADSNVADTSDDTGSGEDTGGEDTSPPPEACSEEGATRSAACGNCGMGQQTCEGGFWANTGECLLEGECAPGEVESEELAMCGARSRICSDACEYSEWDVTSEPGECEAGESRAFDGCEMGETATETCADDCTWNEPSECVNPCGELRSEPWDAVEVCVPAGPYLRFNDDFSEEVEIQVSTFAIDKYTVTWRRLRECFADDGCTGLSGASNPDNDDAWPGTRIRWQQAQEFCAWDGARLIPTIAQFEKAGRGATPSRIAFSYGGEDGSCEEFPVGLACPMQISSPFASHQGYSDYASPFGVVGVGFGRWDWMRDGSIGDYLAEATDPVGEGTAGYVYGLRFSTQPVPIVESSIQEYPRGLGMAGDISAGFRCVREI